MKSGDAVFLHLAATVAEPAHDLTLVFYDCEEIDAAANGLGRIERELPDWLSADVAILGEPTGRLHRGRLSGHAARRDQRRWNPRAFGAILVGRQRDSQTGRRAGPAGRRTSARTVDIDGCAYREGLSAVRIDGGVAGNVIPDAASVTVNFRFAPDRSVAAALQHVHDVFDGLDVRIEQTDAAAGALPGLSQPAAKALVEAAGGQVRAKYGWTDVVAVRRAGHTGGQFRAGRPQPGAPPRRAGAGRQHHRRGGDAAALPGRLAPSRSSVTPA